MTTTQTEVNLWRRIAETIAWTAVMVLLCAAAYSAAEASGYSSGAASDGYAYRDGLWWKDGKPYERYADTCYKTKQVRVAGCCGSWRWVNKRVAHTCYKYRRVPYADPQSGIEKFALELLEAKKGEMRSEHKIREQYAFAKEAIKLAEKFGVTQYHIESYGQNLNYGDQFGSNLGYQFPSQQGSTVYGVREYQGDFYGEAAIRMLDADRAIANAYELRKLSREYDHEAEIALNENVEAMDAARTQQITALAEMRELRMSISELHRSLIPVIESLKAEPRASVKSQGRLEIPEIGIPRTGDDLPRTLEDLDTSLLPDPQELLLKRCANCHDEHAGHQSELFPNGVHFDEMGQWSARQQLRYLELIDSGKMPKKGEPLTEHEKMSLKYLMATK